MHTEDTTRAGHDRPLLRISVLFISIFSLWKLVIAPTLEGDLAEIPLISIGEVAFAGLLITILWRTGLLRKTGFRAPLRLRSICWGLPLLLLASLMVLGSPGLDTSFSMVGGLGILVIGGSLSEEILFRGTLWEGLSGLGPWARSLATSGAFGMMHLIGLASGLPPTVILSQALGAVGIGLIMAAVRLSAGSIWTASLLHIVFNFPALWAGGGIEGTFTPGFEPQLLITAVVMGAWGCFGIHRQVRASKSGQGRGDAPTAESLNVGPSQGMAGVSG